MCKYNIISLCHHSKMAIIMTISIGVDVEKLEHLYIAGWNVK
jgi:hypothetical protein